MTGEGLNHLVYKMATLVTKQVQWATKSSQDRLIILEENEGFCDYKEQLVF